MKNDKNNNKLSINLNDLKVESFETDILNEGKVIAHETECFHICGTGCDTVVCEYPTGEDPVTFQ